MPYLIIYEKPDHKIVTRLRSSIPFFEIGDTTGYGWRVLDIQYLYENKFYSKKQFDKLLYKDYRLRMKKRKRIDRIKKILEKLSS